MDTKDPYNTILIKINIFQANILSLVHYRENIFDWNMLIVSHATAIAGVLSRYPLSSFIMSMLYSFDNRLPVDFIYGDPDLQNSCNDLT